jgi:penicillin-binding protein A
VTRQIRNLGVFLLLCYGALFVQVNRLTIFEAEELKDKPGNTRAIERDFSSPRGTIATSDGVLVAHSVPSDDQYQLQRVYPEGELFAHVTGHYAFELGASGVERTYNDELAGRTIDFDLRELTDLFVDRERVGDLTLTLRADVQRLAREQLGEREGSVVAVDPRNGEIIALWAFPSYDPNQLATHDFDAAADVATLLDADENKPRLARTYQDNFFPGSTFKIVTAAAGVGSNQVSRDEPDYPASSSYQPTSNGQPVGRPIGNFGGATCGGTLFAVLQQSCNTAFTQMGVEDAGAEQMIGAAESFGFNQEVPIDLPSPVQSTYPTDFTDDVPKLAQSSIGQNDVRATPLQMALIAAAVANDGEIMRPHVVREVRDDQGEVIDSYDDGVWTTPMNRATADLLRQGMVSVVTDGTATALAEGLDGYVVGGKTGTAQLGTSPPRSHAWIIGFAGPEGETPHVAVAVIIEGQEGASEQTGGRVAAPIAAAVLGTALEPPTRAAEQAGDEASEG